MRRDIEYTQTEYMLRALIPYTDANLKLTFKPNKFFNELEKKRKIPRKSARSAYHRAIKRGNVELNEEGIPFLTEKGLLKLKKYRPKKLKADVVLMIIFDVPESQRNKRDKLRRALQVNDFKQIQRSVWTSNYDHKDLFIALIKEENLENYVQIYESHNLYV